MQGWVKLHRILLKKPIWQCSLPKQKCVLIAIMLMANHDKKEWIWKGEKYICQPGQFITSLESLSEASGVSVQSVRTALDNFQKKFDFLTSESTNKNRLITIVNWELYQIDDENQQANQQATNKRLTTNKNDKNNKNNIYADEFEKFYLEYPRSQAKQDTNKWWKKRIKEHGIDFVVTCLNNYVDYYNQLPEDKKQFAYASNNFLGTKAYYKDFEKPKVKPANNTPKNTQQDDQDYDLIKKANGY